HWHMHQPIYWPYESIIQTENNDRYDYSVIEIHNVRTGPYTNWPANAVQMGVDAGLPHFGVQVSFSGSLIENLNNLEDYGNPNFQDWRSDWNYVKTQTTSLGNPRLDMVAFGYHHPLLGLIDNLDMRKQIQAHRQIMEENFEGEYSAGIFPPENAFSERMIPGLVNEGIQWVLV
ncbi:MAG: glycosyl hydrolase family 57, partial [Planctomycetes bacterium]|nr:glycosyl hydrolase family 57 [Planctomycetota bacterium]